VTDNQRTMTIQVIRVKYKKDSFCIIDCKILENKDKPQSVGTDICCTGIFYDIHEKAVYTVNGIPTLSKYKTRSGIEKEEWQLKVSKSEKSSRMCIDGLRDYLTRHAPMIGKVKAEKLISKFGEELLSVISNKINLQKVTDVVGERTALMLLEWSNENKDNYELRKELYEVGLTEWQANKIFQFFKHGIRDSIKKRCFELIGVSGFGFKTVCNIADKFGISRNDTGRIDACIIYLIQQEIDQGHSFSFDENIVTESCKILELCKDDIRARIKYLIETKKIFTEETDITEFSNILPGGLSDQIDADIKTIILEADEEEICSIELDDLRDTLGSYVDLDELLPH